MSLKNTVTQMKPKSVERMKSYDKGQDKVKIALRSNEEVVIEMTKLIPPRKPIPHLRRAVRLSEIAPATIPLPAAISSRASKIIIFFKKTVTL